MRPFLLGIFTLGMILMFAAGQGCPGSNTTPSTIGGDTNSNGTNTDVDTGGTDVDTSGTDTDADTSGTSTDGTSSGTNTGTDAGTASQPAGLTPYGTGDLGALVVTGTNQSLSDSNAEYTNFTVSSGAQLTVQSGTVIRCTGTFTNNGTILVDFGAGGSRQTSFTLPLDGAYSPAEAGVSLAPPSPGELGASTANRSGGFGGVGLNASQARTVLYPGVKAGGGSAGGFGSPGMLGGGGLTVIAFTAIVNTGIIDANGVSAGTSVGVGGSAGGVIVLASAGTITQTGTLTAIGGNGGASDTFFGPGGGGGGGIIHLLAPTIVSRGTISVSGGTAGTLGAANSVTQSPRQGGGGGGACAGSGGAGGNVAISGDPVAASAGSSGFSLQTIGNPTAILLR